MKPKAVSLKRLIKSTNSSETNAGKNDKGYNTNIRNEKGI